MKSRVKPITIKRFHDHEIIIMNNQIGSYICLQQHCSVLCMVQTHTVTSGKKQTSKQRRLVDLLGPRCCPHQGRFWESARAVCRGPPHFPLPNSNSSSATQAARWKEDRWQGQQWATLRPSPATFTDVIFPHNVAARGTKTGRGETLGAACLRWRNSIFNTRPRKQPIRPTRPCYLPSNPQHWQAESFFSIRRGQVSSPTCSPRREFVAAAIYVFVHKFVSTGWI